MVIDWPLSIIGVMGVIEEIDKGVVAEAFAIPNTSIINANIRGNALNLARFRAPRLQALSLCIATIILFGIIL